MTETEKRYWSTQLKAGDVLRIGHVVCYVKRAGDKNLKIVVEAPCDQVIIKDTTGRKQETT